MATQMSSAALVGAQGLFDASTTQLENIGAKIESADGRIFRYAKASLALVAGNALQSPPAIANHQTLTPSAANTSAVVVSVTLGASAAAANDYANGYLVVNTTPGNGYAYLISGHAAIAASAAGNINLSDPLQVTVSASSIMDLVYNPYSAVLQLPATTNTGTAVGVAISALPAANFGWVQTHGPVAALNSGTGLVGSGVIGQTITTAGSVAVSGATSTVVIGYLMKVGVDAKNVPVYLTID